jgi:peptidylprolyl isomerase
MARKRVTVRKGDTVRVHYTCKLSNGTVIDSSQGQEPLEFTLGKGEIIKGLEDAVMGMKVGQSKTTTVAPEQTYGLRHEEWMIDVARDKLPEDFRPEVGLHYELPRENGQSSLATVTHVSQTTVTLDFNHPLAGKNLIFEVTLLEIVS